MSRLIQKAVLRPIFLINGAPIVFSCYVKKRNVDYEKLNMLKNRFQMSLKLHSCSGNS